MSVYDKPIQKAEEELQELRVMWKQANSMVAKAQIYEKAKERTKWIERLKQAKSKIEVYK